MSDVQDYPQKGGGWQLISSAPEGREVLDLAWYYEPSATALMNGSLPMWCYAEGSRIYEGCWSGIIGSRPSHWRPCSGEFEL